MLLFKYKNFLFRFSALIICLLAVGILMQHKVGNMLNNTLEQTIAKQTADMSVVAEERFSKELTELHFAANYLSTHPGRDTELNVLSELNKANSGVIVGLLQLNGRSIHGMAVSKTDFPRLIMASRGNDVMDYCIGKGLLFAVPVFNGQNVHNIIYRLYPDRILTQLFGLSEYNSDGRLLIQERNGQIIVPYINYGDSDRDFFSDPTILEGFEKVRGKLATNRSAAIYYEGTRGRYFLFGADLPQTNCSMVGFIPWSAVAGNISRTNVMILVVTSLLLMLFLIASIYMFLLNEKAKKSDEFKREKQEADQANQAKSAFLANMSHEIRTPINAVIGMNEMILRESHEPNTLKYAQNAHAASESLLSLINDILDFSKIESGKMELIEENYHLDELIKNLINMIKSRAEKKNLDFIVNVNENIPNELFGDSVRIRQVVVNFLTNSVKYTKVGSVTFNVDKENRGSSEILLKFSVQDTGIGIRDEDKKKLFTDFTRFYSKKNKNIEGTGLGLAITYRLVKMMKGWINVESVYGEGSTFTVTIPQKVVGSEVVGSFEDKMQSISKQDTYKVSFIAPDAKILVVDDNEMNLLVATSLLKATKIQIDTAMSGMEALKKLAEKSYDIIFLDQMMPSLDGIQTLKLAKSMEDNKSKGVPMIVLTANAISGAKEMFLKEGFTDYLSKPIDAKAFEEMLMYYLPPEKVHAPVEDEESEINNDKIIEQETNPHTNYKYLNVKLGLQYSAGMEDMYKNILTMFCNLKDEKKSKMQEAFSKGDWNNYTTFIHALKSTALSVGGEKTSEAAKLLENEGKILIAAATSELDKHESEEYIKIHHAEAMDLYDKLVEEGRQYLKETSSEEPVQPAEIDNIYSTPPIELPQYESSVTESPAEQSEDFGADIEFMINLQEAFDNEDWIMYSILAQEVRAEGNEDILTALRQIDMACKMVTADFTTDNEKQQAIEYLKKNHTKIMDYLEN